MGFASQKEDCRPTNVYRKSNNSFLARVTIIETKPEMSVCRIDPTMRKGPIQKGDLVVTARQ